MKALILLMAFGVFQASPQEPKFEVASIHVSEPGARGTTMYAPTPERFAATSISVKGLIAFAYDVRDFQISGGPKWLDSNLYDVVARPDGDITGDHVRAMVRSLLAERFGLKIDHATQELPVFVLSVAKNGPKLQISAGAGPDLRGGNGRITGHKITVKMLAGWLGDRVGRPVVDKTGIAGEFDFDLIWTPDDSQEMGPALPTALEEQLGLKLDTERAPVEIVKVREVALPTAN